MTQNVQAVQTTRVMPRWALSTLSFVLIFLAVVLTPNAVAASWLRMQITDTQNFVAMTSTALQDPAVEEFIADKVSTEVIAALDIDGLTADLFGGLQQALPLGDRASAALGLLQQPLADGAKALITDVTRNVVTSEAFENVTEQALTLTHTEVMALLRGDTSGAIVADETGTIGLQVGPIVEAVKEQLLKQNVMIAERIPTVNATIEIGKVEGIVTARVALNTLDAVGYWLPVIVLLLLVLGVLAARQRARAALWSGLGVVVSTALTLGGLSIGQYAFLASVTPEIIPGKPATVIYAALTDRLQQLLVATLFIGVLIIFTAYLVGPFKGAIIVREATGQLAGSIRDVAAKRGVTTGAFGAWLDRAHGFVLGVIIAAGAIVLFLMRPFSVEKGVWTALIVLVAAFVLQLLRNPNGATVAAKVAPAGAATTVAPAVSASPAAKKPAAKKPAAKKPAAKKPAAKKPAAKKPAAKK